MLQRLFKLNPKKPSKNVQNWFDLERLPKSKLGKNVKNCPKLIKRHNPNSFYSGKCHKDHDGFVPKLTRKVTFNWLVVCNPIPVSLIFGKN